MKLPFAQISNLKKLDVSWFLLMLAVVGSLLLNRIMENEESIIVKDQLDGLDHQEILKEALRIEEEWDHRYIHHGDHTQHKMNDWIEVMELPLLRAKLNESKSEERMLMLNTIQSLGKRIQEPLINPVIPVSFLMLRDLLIWVLDQHQLKLSQFNWEESWNDRWLEPLFSLRFEVRFNDQNQVPLSELIKQIVLIGVVEVFTVEHRSSTHEKIKGDWQDENTLVLVFVIRTSGAGESV